MKKIKRDILTYVMLLFTVLFVFGCGNAPKNVEAGHEHEEEEHGEEVHLTASQVKALGIKTGAMPKRNLSAYVEANGELEVNPQNEASVTAIIGANVTGIKVIEGDKVKKGQVLAYLSHPDLIRLQMDYVNSLNQLQFLEQEFKRQKRLYEEKVGSGKEFQQVQANYHATRSMVKGYEAQLRLMDLDIEKLKNGKIYEQVPVVSPIGGFVRFVNIKMRQYVAPQTEMFDIVCLDDIHADFMVFEKDMYKVKEGQKVKFTIQSMPEKEMDATIFAIGKAFESNPKALHLHAHIENKEGLLLPGMYVRGRIIIDDMETWALPEEAIIRDGDKYFVFTVDEEDEENNWAFKPLEVLIGIRDNGWVEIKFLDPVKKGTTFAWNNAYYLLADMKKGELEHGH